MKAYELISQHTLKERQYKELVSSIKFKLGSLSEMHSLSSYGKEKLCRPPYPISLFEFYYHPETYFILIVDDGHGLLKCFGFGYEHRGCGWYQEGIRVEIFYEKNEVEIIKIKSGKVVSISELEKNGGSELWWTFQILRVVFCLEVIACSNIVLIDNPVPKHIKLKEKEKSFRYIYKTLHIITNNAKKKNIKKGSGTHAGPKVHLRRGHIRRLSNKNKIWIQSCVVGNKKRGIVYKDYKINDSNQI